MAGPAAAVSDIVFDLDGTLYESPALAEAIRDAAVDYLAGIRGISAGDARQLLNATRSQLKQSGRVGTLSAVCCELGGTVQALHVRFEELLQPEQFLTRDQRVIDLLQLLSSRCALHLYTNNNRRLTDRIIDHLGLNGLFRNVFVIDDTWRAKPDRFTLDRVLAAAGSAPQRTLFVGDRHDVDLQLPQSCGCPVYLSQTVEQLLQLENMILPAPS